MGRQRGAKTKFALKKPPGWTVVQRTEICRDTLEVLRLEHEPWSFLAQEAHASLENVQLGPFDVDLDQVDRR
jgi:hypothetical protein